MDYRLPDDETMQKMAEEFARVLPRAGALSLPDAGGPPLFPARDFLLLYFAFALGYNFGYGNALTHADGDMGRSESRQRGDGDFDFFFPRKG